MINKGQTVQIFEGERYKNCGLDEDALSEIIIYQKMLKEVSKALWKQRHPDRTRLPADFEKMFFSIDQSLSRKYLCGYKII